MASRRLISILAGIVIVHFGASAESTAVGAPWDSLVDWAIGAAFVLAALTRATRGPTAGSRGELIGGRARSLWQRTWGLMQPNTETALGLVTAAAWYAATLGMDGVDPVPELSGVATLAYRAFLLQWIVRHAPPQARPDAAPMLLALAYATGLIATRISALSTAVLALLLAGAFAHRGRTGQAEARGPAREAALMLLALGSLWSFAGAGLLLGHPAAVSAVVLLPVAWRLSRSPGASTLNQAIGRLVVDLSPQERPATPVTAVLARTLADPGLRLALDQAGEGWVDELGRPLDDSLEGVDPALRTELVTPEGGRLLLIHSPAGAGDSDLARAAAAAAALGLARAHLDAELRRTGAELQRSAARLLAVSDTERQALAERLRAGVVARLEAVRESWSLSAADERLTAELDRIIGELDRLAQGLAPQAAHPTALAASLTSLAHGVGLPVETTVDQDVARLPVDVAALAYFVAAEGLTNVARHSGATVAHLTVRCSDELVIALEDDGCGGAALTPGGGLQGLADRISVAGGTLAVRSPLGGPTRVVAQLPLAGLRAPGPSPLGKR